MLDFGGYHHKFVHMNTEVGEDIAEELAGYINLHVREKFQKETKKKFPFFYVVVFFFYNM